MPFEFRAEFGDEMQQIFQDERRELPADSDVLSRLRFWVRTLWDFARTAPREQWDILRQDLRVGCRMLARSRTFAGTAILTLALAIGASTSIFSVVYAVVLRPLQFPHPDRVLHIGWAPDGRPAAPPSPMTFDEFRLLREASRSFETTGVVLSDSLSSERGPLRLQIPVPGFGTGYRTSIMASAVLFKTFGVSPVLGRLIDERDEAPGAAPVAVISYDTWTSAFGRDPRVIGRTLVRYLSGEQRKPVTIVGVLKADAFRHVWPDSPEPPAVSALDPDALYQEHGAFLDVYARLRPGTTLESARAELVALTPTLVAQHPATSSVSRTLLHANRVHDELVRDVRLPLLAFLFAVLGLLLVACVNVGSLVLARNASRRHEFAARFALGARPLRVARQMLTETAIVAAFGGMGGLALGWAGWRAFIAISPSMPRLGESGFGVPALLFASAVMFVVTCGTALVPAFCSASPSSATEGLRRASGNGAAAPRTSKSLALLAGLEIAVVLMLIAGTGLLVNSFARLVAYDLGFDPRTTVVVSVRHSMPRDQAPRPAGGAIAHFSDRQRSASAIGDEILSRVGAISGVAAVGLTGDDPFGSPYRYSDVRVEEGAPLIDSDRRVASPTALQALGLRMLKGRWFNENDREGTTLAAVVSRAMAEKCWNGQDAVGRTFLSDRWTFHVIGVIADVHSLGARQEAKPTYFLSTRQVYPDPAVLVVKKRTGSPNVESLAADELNKFGGRIQVGSPRPLETVWWRQLADARFLTLVVSVFSLLALIIALVGVHGILRFSVAQRTREMGIRKALGAGRAGLVALVVGQALRFALPACLVGLLGAFAVAPALRSLLFGVKPSDPTTLIGAALLLLAAVVVAAYFPARRASQVDPVSSLRCE